MLPALCARWKTAQGYDGRNEFQRKGIAFMVLSAVFMSFLDVFIVESPRRAAQGNCTKPISRGCRGADSMVQFRYSFMAMGVAALGSGLASVALKGGNLLANRVVR